MNELSDPTFKEMDERVFLYNTLDARLGSGTFGSVYKGRVIDPVGNKIEVAIKTFNNRNFRDTEIEAKLMQELDHPNIVKVIKTGNSKTYGFYLAMELCETTLKGYLEKHQLKKFREEDAGPLFRDICEGIKYLQSKGILHRDLKMDNIMITKSLMIKIGDFGLAKLLEGDITSTTCGSPHIMAPEIFRKDSYGMESDIWSLGVLLFGMVTGEECLYRVNKMEYERRILNFTAVPFKPEWPLSPKVKNLIEGMLQPDPKKRLTVDEILAHPWLEQFQGQDDLMASQFVLKTIVQSSSGPDRIGLKLSTKFNAMIWKELYRKQSIACSLLDDFMKLLEQSKTLNLLNFESNVTLQRAVYAWIKPILDPKLKVGQTESLLVVIEPDKLELARSHLGVLYNYLAEVPPKKYYPEQLFLEAVDLLLDSAEYLSYEDNKESISKLNWDEQGQLPQVMLTYKLMSLFLDMFEQICPGTLQISQLTVNAAALKEYQKYTKCSAEVIQSHLQQFMQTYKFSHNDQSSTSSSQHDELVCSLLDLKLSTKESSAVKQDPRVDAGVVQLKSKVDTRIADLRQNVYLRNS